jgi:hypothetical protein
MFSLFAKEIVHNFWVYCDLQRGRSGTAEGDGVQPEAGPGLRGTPPGRLQNPLREALPETGRHGPNIYKDTKP